MPRTYCTPLMERDSRESEASCPPTLASIMKNDVCYELMRGWVQIKVTRDQQARRPPTTHFAGCIPCIAYTGNKSDGSAVLGLPVHLESKVAN